MGKLFGGSMAPSAVCYRVIPVMLIIAALVWIALHIGLAGTRLRDRIVRGIGERPFRGVFSALSIVALIWLIRSYNVAATASLWRPPSWLVALLVLAMLPACLLFIGSVTAPNPTMIAGERVKGEPRGFHRITRHPMLWSFAIWAGVHIIGMGDTASLVFFGAFLITALAGMPSIDAKLARRDRATWSTLETSTSVVPFVAIAQGRNRLVWNEIGLWRAGLGLILWALFLYLHPIIIGVSPLPH
jgi:uncharacterized membrane protein